MNNVIDAKQVTKSFGHVRALDHVSFSVAADKIYGLLGGNGAGKSTLMQIIAAHQFQTSGDLQVFGANPYENANVLRRVCFIKESPKYPHGYRVEDVMKQAALFFGTWDEAFAMELMTAFALPPHRKTSKLSRGMLSALGIVVGLASRAPLTIFDEPHLGLDVRARELFYHKLLEDYLEHPRTILLSTHLVDEVSLLLEHVFVLHEGRLIVDEEADVLRNQGYAVAGSTLQIDAFASGRRLVHQETLGGLASATFLEKLDAKARQDALELGLELVPISLQQLVLHLTKNPSVIMEVNR